MSRKFYTPRAWNSLPSDIRASTSLIIFRRKLKDFPLPSELFRALTHFVRLCQVPLQHFHDSVTIMYILNNTGKLAGLLVHLK